MHYKKSIFLAKKKKIENRILVSTTGNILKQKIEHRKTSFNNTRYTKQINEYKYRNHLGDI